MTMLGSGRTKHARHVVLGLSSGPAVSSILTLKDDERNAVDTDTPGHDFLFSPKTR